jgi:hypothetical protein
MGMNCAICGCDGETHQIDQVVFSEDKPHWELAGWIQPHHVEVPGDPDSLSAPICRMCMRRVFTHMAENQPEGSLEHYGDEPEVEKHNLAALAAFEGMLSHVDGDVEAYDVLKFIEGMIGVKLTFDVSINLDGTGHPYIGADFL